MAVAFVIVAATSRQVGKPVWWLGDAPLGPTVWWIVPLIGPGLAVLASLAAPFRAIGASALATLASLAIGLGDLGTSPGAAVFEIALAVAGALVTVAAVSGWPRGTSRRVAADSPTRR